MFAYKVFTPKATEKKTESTVKIKKKYFFQDKKRLNKVKAFVSAAAAQ